MRVLLLCSLGALLVWFAWHSLASSSASAAYGTASPGAMLPPETGAPAVSARPAERADPGHVTLKPESMSGSTAANAPRAAAIPEPGSAPAAISIVPDKLETQLARELVSAPESFCALVSKHTELPKPRRNFALALGKALEGKRDEARGLANGLAEDPLVRTSERAFLDRLVEGRVSTAQSASTTTESALVWATLIVTEARHAAEFESAGKAKEAASGYSRALLDYVRAAWVSDPEVLRRWSAALAKNQREYRWNRLGEWPSVTVEVAPGDNLIGLRKRVLQTHPELLFCTGQIQRANEMSNDTVHPGQTLRIPTERARMLVDLDAHWAFYIVGEEVAAAWEVGVGKDGATRAGSYIVGDKREQPMWFPQGQEPVPFGAPENPLGTRWIQWLSTNGQQNTGLGFHGTKDPRSIGKDESQGCIRMRNEDVEELFEILPKGAAIQVQV